MDTINFQSIASQRQGQTVLSGILAAVAAALGLVPYVAIYFIAVHLFETGVNNADAQFLFLITGGSLIATTLKSVVMGLSLHISHAAAYDILYEARLALARKFGALPLGFFDENNTGAVKRVIHEDVEKMEETLAHIVPELVAAVTVPLLSFIIMLFIDWRLGLLMMASPILGTVFFGLINHLFGSDEMKTYYSMVDRMNSAVIQYINGMKVIKAFTRSEASFADLKEVINEMVVFYTKMGVKVQRVYSGVPVAFRTGPLFILPVSLILYLGGSLDLPTLLFFLLMSLGFARPIYNFMMHGMMAFYQISTAMKRIDGLLDEQSLEEPTLPQTPQDFSITFGDVVFSYGNEADAKRVLEHVSFVIPQGSVTALVGPSGSGKTTIARLIPRFWDVQDGQVEIGGVDVRQMTTSDLMNAVSFVFQEVFLFNDTFYENIRVGNLDATEEQVIAASKLARCHDFIQELGGYEQQIGENGAKLSGGQRQRLSIARAILKNAPIIVLDEATAFVDPENESLIQEAIAALLNSTPEQPKTLVVVAHRLSTITEADQILLVNQGQIVAAGTHNELLGSNKLYQTLWKAHTDITGWEHKDDISLSVNRNTTYDGTYAPLENPYEGLKTAKGHWSRVASLVAGERPLFWRGILWSFIEGGFIAYPIFIIYLAILALYNAELTSTTILTLFIGLLAIFFGQYLFSFLSYKDFLRLDVMVQRNLRVFLSDYLRRLPLGFFTKHDVGYIDALFTTTIEFLETRLTTTTFVSGVVAPSLVFIFALFVDWRMALAMGVSVPLALLLLRQAMLIFDQVWHTQREARKQANSRMVEYIHGISVIRAFNLPGERFSQFDDAMDTYRVASRQTTTRITPAIIGFVSVLEIGFALMLALGVWLTIDGSLTIERFLIFMLLGTAFYTPMIALADMISFQRIVANGINNINEFLRSPMLPQPSANRAATGYGITFEDVHFSYSDEKVLQGVSFSIPEQHMVALVGRKRS